MTLHGRGADMEYRKEFGFLSSFCSGFALMSYTTGITGAFSLAYNDGGPVMVWSNWVLASVMNIAVALGLAEIVSAMPVAGGPYYWCMELTNNDPHWAILGWVTGWLNVLGQFATTAFAADILAAHIASMFLIGNGHVFSNVEMLLAYAVILVLAGCLCSVSTRGAKWSFLISGLVLLLGGVGASIALLVVAPTLQPASWAVRQYNADDISSSNLPSLAYMYLLGMLMGQATFIGYEAPTQFAEETRNASRNIPWAIVLSLVATSLCGGLHIASLLFSVQDVSAWENGNSGGYLVAQVYHDVFQARYGSPTGGVILMLVPAVTMLCSTTISLSTNSRVLRAMAGDKGVPLSKVFRALNEHTRTPVNATWAMAALAFLLGLPLLYSTSVFSAIASISSVGLYLSYGVPIFLRIYKGREFCHGPFSLGGWYLPIGVIAIAWVLLSTIAFMLPTAYPCSYENFNYASVTVGVAVLVVCLAWYFPRYGARHAFRGGVRQVDYIRSGRVPSCEDTARGRRKSLAARPSLDEGKALNGKFELQRSLSESKLTLLDLLAEHQAKAAPRPPSQRAARPYEHKHYIARVSAARGLTADGVEMQNGNIERRSAGLQDAPAGDAAHQQVSRIGALPRQSPLPPRPNVPHA